MLNAWWFTIRCD